MNSTVWRLILLLVAAATVTLATKRHKHHHRHHHHGNFSEIIGSCAYDRQFSQATCFDVKIEASSSPLNSTVISRLEKLTFKNLSGVVTNSLFAPAPNLTLVTLMRSTIENIASGAFDGLPNLLFLVFLENNRIPNFSEMMFSGTSEHLSWLSVIANNNSFEVGALRNLKNLTWLHIQHQNFHILSGDFLRNLTKLHELTIENCGLREVDADAFHSNTELEILSLNFNKITSFHADTFKSLKKLKIFELHHNHLANFELGQFSGLSSLEIIGFPSRFFRNIRNSSDLFETFPNLKKIEVKRHDLFAAATRSLVRDIRDNNIHIIGTPHDCHLPEFFTCHKRRMIIT